MRTAAIGILALSLVGATGCRQTADLEPAPAARTIGQAAVDSVDDVQVQAKAEWTGRDEVRDQVLPIKVKIKNDNSVPVRVRYDNFKLVSADGQRYSVIPPFQVEGQISRPITAPGFTATRFEIAPYYSTYYPGLTAFGGPFAYDPLYYDQYHTYWANLRLPTDYMLNNAMPEGVVMPGGEIEGFLYFETVPDDAERVSFRADLVNARTGEAFGEVSIPFVEQD